MIRYFTYVESRSDEGAGYTICGRDQEEGVPYHVTAYFGYIPSATIKGAKHVQFLLSGRFTQRTFCGVAIIARFGGTIILFNDSIDRELRPVDMINGVGNLYPVLRTVNCRINRFAVSENAFLSYICCYFVDLAERVFLRFFAIRCIITMVVDWLFEKMIGFGKTSINWLL